MKFWAKIACYVVVGNTVVTIGNLNLIRSSTNWLVHSYQAQVAVRDVVADVRDIEIGARGFIITKQERFLQPFYRGRERLINDFESLAAFVGDNDNQMPVVNEMRKSLPIYHEIVDKAISSIRSGEDPGHDGSKFVAMIKEGRASMDVVRAGFRRMQQEEERVTNLRTERLRWANNWMWINVGTFMFAQVVFLVATIYRLIYHPAQDDL